MADVGVSVSEVIEARGCGFNDEELLALIIVGCEQCTKTSTGFFSPDQVYIFPDGRLKIQTVSSDQLSEEFIPPEITDGNTNINAGAAHIYCLGQTVRAAAATNLENVDILSLINVMTVAHIATRPTAIRLAQMAKNKLNIQNPKAMFAEMYTLVMGDEADDDDEYELSSGAYNIDDVDLTGDTSELIGFLSKKENITESLSSNKKFVSSDEEKNGHYDANKSGIVLDEFSDMITDKNLNKSDAERIYLESVNEDKDPFEEENGSNLLTISGKDPFPDLNQNDLASTSEEQVPEKAPRKERQRSVLVESSISLLGRLETDKEESSPMKNYAWPDLRNRSRDFNYDDDIVEYKDDEIDSEFDSFLAKENFSLKSHENVNHLKNFRSDLIDQNELHSSLSPISEDNEITDKGNDSSSHGDFAEKYDSDSDEVSSKIFTEFNDGYSKELNESVKIPFASNEIRDKNLFENGEYGGTRDSTELINRREFFEKNANKISDEISPPTVIPPTSEDEEPLFKRRNSLLPHRISGRKPSQRHTRKSKAEPEFILNQGAPSVCLKAPALRKKKVTLHRIEQTDVTVELLNGKRIEVSCRSDTVACEIADVVMRHINYNENSFFSLTVLKGGEHFFLDEHQRIEKFAPSGWKNARQYGLAKNLFMLHLRFKYYPATISFIRTSIVLHEFYLQLRRDILDDRLQPDQDKAFELAALSLQAEYSDRPSVAINDYFKVEHYLPKAYFIGDEKRAFMKLAELHGHYNGMSTEQAERQFITNCQSLSDYGAHLHRVYRSKPSVNLGNTPLGDPETGVLQWIVILTRGILICEEQNGKRVVISEHLWQDTQTLQFDKKRFVIVSEISRPSRSIFYTDHYTKSAYFVRFAASQHRFMIRMRQWNQTLRSDTFNSEHKATDVGIDALRPKVAEDNFEEKHDNEIENQSNERSKLYEASTPILVSSREDIFRQDVNEKIINDLFEEDTENSDGFKFEVVLRKNSKTGLGLTLVDGNLNGVQGVYVKSVIDGGAGMKGGLIVGDRLLRINDTSLVGKDRHAAVDLVKQSDESVRLFIFRWDAISTMLATNKWKTAIEEKKRIKAFDNVGDALSNNRSRTPPVTRRLVDTPKKRVRAVSDFGALGDALPELNSEEMLASIRPNSGSNIVNICETWHSEEKEVSSSEGTIQRINSAKESLEPSYPFSPPLTEQAVFFNSASSLLRQQNDEQMIFDNTKSNNNSSTSDVNYDVNSNFVSVVLERNESGSLGVQIASSGGFVFVKQLIAEPAISNPNIRIGDKLLTVNGQGIQNLAHQQVVDLLRNGGDNVSLGLSHPEDMILPDDLIDAERTITVVLDKSSTGSLGLSLAKKTGLDGIFIRSISSGSAADIDGTLRVGDKVWKVNGEFVGDLTPGLVIDMLKCSINPIEIVVKRSFR